MSTKKRILVVDDDPQIVDMLKTALERVGYEVDGAGTGRDALRAIHDRIYDAAILDFALPDMNGLALHREIRQIDGELAHNTLFCSGLDQSDQNLGYYATYGVGFLSKPFDLQEVIDSLESLWTVD
ncbi:MAG: response regulator [Acidobacteria bacterium]|nr:response regulator [Acidobacteriota bacterium]NIM62108.1 response regulator [Acidobacteriota bacterium]NIO59740.1 response regulator [Acidobacteriota bacterium]NIQ30823.1 response regulator [Acidobacteriota bacterium]NIQ85896.1 response regulator [Acidobacteriota bacterium]